MNGVACRRRIGPGFSGAFLVLLACLGACSSEPELLRFAAMGDMGTGGPGQLRIADVMAERARAQPIQLWLTLGDNIYPWGVLSPDDSSWAAQFESVYDDPALRVPVYPTLGNHDHVGFPVAQVRYSDRSDTWTMPDQYYTFSRFLADGTEIAFFALDTEIIRAGATAQIDDAPIEQRVERVRRFAENMEVDLAEPIIRTIAERVHIDNGYALVRIVMLAERTGREVDENVVEEALAGSGAADYPAQLEWLDRSLAESGARWKIVYGHHPLYSHATAEGRYATMIERLEPILVRHGVDLYLAGHDHVLDMMKPIHGVYHVTSGGGSGDDEAYDVVQTDESYYAATGGGITFFRVTTDELVIEFLDLDGVARHTQVIRHGSSREDGE